MPAINQRDENIEPMHWVRPWKQWHDGAPDLTVNNCSLSLDDREVLNTPKESAVYTWRVNISQPVMYTGEPFNVFYEDYGICDIQSRKIVKYWNRIFYHVHLVLHCASSDTVYTNTKV